jgi:prefoldin subunit 5
MDISDIVSQLLQAKYTELLAMKAEVMVKVGHEYTVENPVIKILEERIANVKKQIRQSR